MTCPTTFPCTPSSADPPSATMRAGPRRTGRSSRALVRRHPSVSASVARRPPSTDPGAGSLAVPFHDPLRTPHVGAAHRHVRLWHLPPRPVRAHRRHPHAEERGDVGRRPPLSSLVGSLRHPVILADRRPAGLRRAAGGSEHRLRVEAGVRPALTVPRDVADQPGRSVGAEQERGRSGGAVGKVFHLIRSGRLRDPMGRDASARRPPLTRRAGRHAARREQRRG